MESRFTLIKKKSFIQRNITMLILTIIWGLFLSLNTWTSNLGKLFTTGTIHFKWVSSPHFLSFFNFRDLTMIHHYFYLIKLGHFLGFAIMDFLLFQLTKKHAVSIWISLFYAFFTEFFQFFFGRDGRLYDLCIDSFGILAVYFFLKHRKNQRMEN